MTAEFLGFIHSLSQSKTLKWHTLYLLWYMETAVAWAKIWWCETKYGSLSDCSCLPGANIPVSNPLTAVWRGSFIVIQFLTLSPKLAKQVSA